MKASENCLRIIKEHEGLRLKAYKCPAGVWTIGYGHTPAREGQQITQAEADALLRRDVVAAELAVSQVRQKLTQNQFDALVSFTFNCGVGAFLKSTLRKLVEANPHNPAISAEFARWNKAGGKILPGLTARRAHESKLYFA